jgi:hypothetical protein
MVRILTIPAKPKAQVSASSWHDVVDAYIDEHHAKSDAEGKEPLSDAEIIEQIEYALKIRRPEPIPVNPLPIVDNKPPAKGWFARLTGRIFGDGS